MRIARFRIHRFKGLDVEIPWASAMVLFGPNDSGKSNVLEAFLYETSDEQVLRGPQTGVPIDFDIELDGLSVEGHPDREILLRWLLSANVEVIWCPSLQGTGVPGLEDLTSEMERLLKEARREYRHLVEEWAAPEHQQALYARLREAVTRMWEQLLDFGADLEVLGIETGDQAAGSQWFTVEHTSARWLPHASGDGAKAALAIFDHRWPAVRSWIELASNLEPLQISVIRVQPSSGSLAGFFQRLEGMLPVLAHGYRDADDEGDAWVRGDGEVFSLQPSMQRACHELSARANDLAPPFVSASYAVEVAPLYPHQWADNEGRRIAVRLHSRGGGLTFDLDVASSGIAAWTSLAVAEAARVLYEEREARDAMTRILPRRTGPTVYVFDEPEAHLHPVAQEQAAAWVADRVRAGAFVLIATHAIPFLRLPLQDVEYFKVSRSSDWRTTVEPITDDVLGAVAGSAASLGLPPVALIQLTRGWLVVEGEHDRMILDAFYRGELRSAGVQILPLRGAMRAEASFLNLAALAPLRIPFFCLLDNARAEAVREGRIAVGRGTEEERVAEQLWRLREEKHVDVEVLGLPFPDIICALPIEAVREIAEKNGGKPGAATSWPDLIARHQQCASESANRPQKPPNFKAFVVKALGLSNWSADKLVVEVLRERGEQPAPSGALSRIVSRVVAAVDDSSVARGGGHEPVP